MNELVSDCHPQLTPLWIFLFAHRRLYRCVSVKPTIPWAPLPAHSVRGLMLHCVLGLAGRGDMALGWGHTKQQGRQATNAYCIQPCVPDHSDVLAFQPWCFSLVPQMLIRNVPGETMGPSPLRAISM
jgi:hypothetical protein